MANVQLGIQAQAKTVSDAQNQATKAMNDVMAALTANGVAQKDIQTQYYNIQQTTSWDNNKQEQIVTGYQINNIVSIKVRGVDTDATRAGTVIDAVTLAGGDLTRINSIQFTVDDPTSRLRPGQRQSNGRCQRYRNTISQIGRGNLGKTYFHLGI